MSLVGDWMDIVDVLMPVMDTEEPTSSLAQYMLEETWDGEDPDSVEIELAYNEIKRYLVDSWACNPDT